MQEFVTLRKNNKRKRNSLDCVAVSTPEAMPERLASHGDDHREPALDRQHFYRRNNDDLASNRHPHVISIFVFA